MKEYLTERNNLMENTSKHHEVRHAREENIYNVITEIVTKHSSDIEPTAMPAIKLHMYNFIANNEKMTEEEIEKEFKKVNRLSSLEKEYSNEKNILPTIGIEIEIPRENLTVSKVKILDKLGIPNYREDFEELWEVNPDFSYSPWVQSRIIQELADMNALPLETKTENSDQKVVGAKLLSMHVNFGVTEKMELDKLKRSRPEIYLMNDTLTYAFSSPDRLEYRKTSTSMHIKGDAKKSKKIKEVYNDSDDNDDNDDSYRRLYRLELRAGEFRDYPTYRMLAEAQRLTTMLMAKMKSKAYPKESLTGKQQELAFLWDKFEKEIQNLLSEFRLYPNDMDDDDNIFYVIKTLKKTDLKSRCRKITTSYSQEIAKILKLEEETMEA